MFGISGAGFLPEEEKEKPGFLQSLFPTTSAVIGAGVDAIGDTIGDMQEQGTTGSSLLDTGLGIASQVGSGVAQEYQDFAKDNLMVGRNDQNKMQLPAEMQAKLDAIENPQLRAQKEAKIRAAANRATAGGGGVGHLKRMGYSPDQVKWIQDSQPKSDLQSNMVAGGTGGGGSKYRSLGGGAPGGIGRWFTAAGGPSYNHPSMMTPQQLAMRRRNAHMQRRQGPPSAAPGPAVGATAPTPTQPTPGKKPDLDWDKLKDWGQDAWGWLT